MQIADEVRALLDHAKRQAPGAVTGFELSEPLYGQADEIVRLAENVLKNEEITSISFTKNEYSIGIEVKG